MDKAPRPTPRRSRNTNRDSDRNVDYQLLSAIGIEPDDPIPFIDTDDDGDDPDACPACGSFHYGKQHAADHLETGAVYLRPLNQPCAKCGRNDCTNIGHFIKAGYIKDGSLDTTRI